MEGVLALAKAHDLRVIEDAAQALGAAYRGTPVGSLGVFGTYSFFPSKNLGGFGDGGLLVTNDDALAERASILRTHGSKPKYYHQFIGGNFRLAPLQAALLSVKLPHYADYTAKRRANAAFYTEQLSKLPGVALGEVGETCASSSRLLDPKPDVHVVLPMAHPVNGSIWNQYTLRVIGESRRDAMKAKLTDLGVGTEIYYPVPMHEQKCFAHLGHAPADLPVASRLARESLSIPIYPELARAQQEHVVQAIASALSK
jgi:dTDP-4-amino-4,6-dideoxygalactose transaminase